MAFSPAGNPALHHQNALAEAYGPPPINNSNAYGGVMGGGLVGGGMPHQQMDHFSTGGGGSSVGGYGGFGGSMADYQSQAPQSTAGSFYGGM